MPECWGAEGKRSIGDDATSPGCQKLLIGQAAWGRMQALCASVRVSVKRVFFMTPKVIYQAFLTEGPQRIPDTS